ncbi:hypothetical protein B0H14DRAFT_2958952 [Mycena olivaceomarginata]|nr:hypothetical protein B0H14DRAFT_2958952 [Mycena olivaceomarginata]
MMELLDHDTFLQRLAALFESSKEHGSIWLTHKRLIYEGADITMGSVGGADGGKRLSVVWSRAGKKKMTEPVVVDGPKRGNGRRKRQRQLKAAGGKQEESQRKAKQREEAANAKSASVP